MKVKLRWLLTSKVVEIAESNDILHDGTTVLELKGLVHLEYGFPVEDIVMAFGDVLGNAVRLRDIGITDPATAAERIINVHVVNDAALEPPPPSSGIEEFSHEEFILANRFVGRSLPVMPERLQELRRAPPARRPLFVATQRGARVSLRSDAPPRDPTRQAAPPEAHAVPRLDRHDDAFSDVLFHLKHGLRTPAASRLSVKLPQVEETFEFWDMRLPAHSIGRPSCDLFYFGEYSHVEQRQAEFVRLACETIERECRLSVSPVGSLREGGCMYPLVVLHVTLAEHDAMQLGAFVFEHFGTAADKPQRSGGSQRCDPQ